jgi:ABC-type multidrug transport system ATPase subunit/pSer/pThr/pTyr-binding forkhead associated (FHA) protein
MKISLSEEIGGQLQPEREFDAATVRVGRDGNDCQFVFDGNQWPMVSRKHAEFRIESGRNVIVDLKSRFGTFLDGRQVSEPAEIRAGSRVQLGPGGPVFRVMRITPVQVAPVNPVPGRVESPAVPAAPQKIPPTTPYQESAFLELATDGSPQRYEIARDVATIGRDVNMDIRIPVDVGLVSRRHAVIKRLADRFELIDQDSFNGTLLNGQRIVAASPLGDGDQIQLGRGGPVLYFRDPKHPKAQRDPRARHEGEAAMRATMMAPVPQMDRPGRPQPGSASMGQKGSVTGGHGPAVVHAFVGDAPITIGRAADIDVRLDGLQISNYHALVSKLNGAVFIEDTGSTNGVYVNGTRIKSKVPISTSDTVQIGPFLLLADPVQGLSVLDTRSKTRIDAIDITKIVPNRSGGGTVKLLDDVDLTIQPNEFVGLLGPSGAGKSTLMDALNGMRPATNGLVLINSQDFYEHLDSLKQSIGYVPQDDIIHRELTVYRTLYYVARLRLSSDVSTQEIDQIINEVMDVTGLAERRDVPVGQLSGGQRKRVSIAVELITKPSIIYLDEPTSGLDPATEEKVMKLFRQIAESGRTVILTTHAMENVKLFDKIVVLMRGKLVWYGGPQAALNHVGAASFKELYDKLEAPIEAGVSKLPALPANATAEQKRSLKLQREQISEQVAEEWKRRFTETEEYRTNILEPLGSLKGAQRVVAPVKHRPSVTDGLRQWKTLAQRYMEVLRHDKFNLLILFGQAPIVAFLTYLVVAKDSPRDFPYFVLALVSGWFGTSIAAREIVKERAVYNRERMVNLGLLPYVASKLLVLSLIVGLQCILLFGLLRLLELVGLMDLPGEYYGAPQLVVMILTGMVGIALGLFISAIVKTSEMATSFVPLMLIPQLLFCGLVGVPKGVSKYVGVIMPATWSYDEMKRFSSLPVLRGKDEEAQPAADHDGRGLYKDIKYQNDQLVDGKQKEVEDYKSKSEDKFEDFDKKMNTYQKDVEKWNMGGRQGREPTKPAKPKLDPVPPKVKVVELPDDLSGYVDFLHPWGNRWLDPLILLVMFFGLTGGTILALRSQDIG